jgi:hypothetical protein
MSVISRVTLQEMISEVRRELLQRAVVYGRLLAKGEMEADDPVLPLHQQSRGEHVLC